MEEEGEEKDIIFLSFFSYLRVSHAKNLGLFSSYSSSLIMASSSSISLEEIKNETVDLVSTIFQFDIQLCSICPDVCLIDILLIYNGIYES